MLVACGGFDGRLTAAADIMPAAVTAVDALNTALGCEAVKLSEGDGAAWLDGKSQIYFSEAMNRTAAGFTHEERDTHERDIMVRPKPAFVEVHGTLLAMPPPEYDQVIMHELGHAFGLGHANVADEVMSPAGSDYKDPDKMARFVAALRAEGAGCH